MLVIDDVVYLKAEDIQAEVRAATTDSWDVPSERRELGIGRIREFQDLLAYGTEFVCRYDVSWERITNPGAVRKLFRGRGIIKLAIDNIAAQGVLSEDRSRIGISGKD